MPALSLIGVPSSAASYAAGQDQAPYALRAAGLVRALTEAGLDVEDAGDLTEQVWAPDPQQPHAQNAGLVAQSLAELTGAVPNLLRDDRRLLVLGGNCTIAAGMVAGMNERFGTACGLVYVDRHFDLNTPETTIEGALDWMGVAHALDLPGSDASVVDALGKGPVLRPDRLVYLGVDPSQATDFERDRVAELGVAVVTQAELLDDPSAAAQRASAVLPDTPFCVHVDVDVLDFIDAPLSENTSGRNIGPSLDQLGRALRVLVGDPRWRALSIGEINPTRSAGSPGTLPRFVTVLASVLAAAP